MAPAGFTFDGQTSVHSKAAWQRHTPRSPSTRATKSALLAWRGSSTLRQAAARAAGPAYCGSLPAMRAGADAQAALDAVLEACVGLIISRMELCLPDKRHVHAIQTRHKWTEIHQQVPDDREIAQRLQA